MGLGKLGMAQPSGAVVGVVLGSFLGWPGRPR